MMNDLRHQRNEDQSSASKNFVQYIFKCGILIFSSFVLFILINQLKFYLIYDETSDHRYYPSEILHLFRKHDRNDDNYLSLDEFEPIALQLNNKRVSSDYIQPILNSDQLVTINAGFEPLNFSAMTKGLRHTYLVCNSFFFIFFIYLILFYRVI
jgi:hypothetical protein